MRLDPNDYLMVHRSHLCLASRPAETEGNTQFRLSIDTNAVFNLIDENIGADGAPLGAVQDEAIMSYGRALFHPKPDEATPEVPVEETEAVTP